MAVSLTVRVDARRALRRLRRVRRKAVPFAQRDIMNEGAKALKLALEKQWRRDMDARRKAFPRTVLRVRRAYVGRGTFRPARVVNVAADELLRDQIEGGVRTPTHGRSLFVRATRRKQRKQPRDFRAGRYVFRARKRGGDRYLGVLSRRARIPRRWKVRVAVRRVARVLPRIARRVVAAEVRKARGR